MAAPTLSGFAPSLAVSENAVNAAPQLLDGDVTFVDAEGNLDGGALTVSGLLAEDGVSVRHQGSGPGELGFDAVSGQVESRVAEQRTKPHLVDERRDGDCLDA